MSYFPIGKNPVSIVASPILASNVAARFVYVVDQEASPNATILGFNQNTSTGALTPTASTSVTTVAGVTVATGTKVGVTPSAMIEDPTGKFVYVTDQSLNQVYGFVVATGGTLVPMVSSPFATGLFPVGITIDPRGKYLYTANYNSNTLSAYAIDTASGALSSTSGSTSVAVGTGPTCVTIEPARGIYLYTSNQLDNSVTGLQLDPHNGGLKNVQNTPFTASGLPTCTVAVANGSHPTQALDN